MNKEKNSIFDTERATKTDLNLQDLEMEIDKINLFLQELKVEVAKGNTTAKASNEITEVSSEGSDFKSSQPPIHPSSRAKKSRKDGIATGEIEKPSVTKASQVRSAIFDVLFYMIVAILVIGVYFFANSNNGSNAPKSLLGYSAMVVLTGSMQSEIPQGSVIITKVVDPNTLEVGDDITYLMNGNTTVTHRIIEIHENFENTTRGFETQGIMNAEPDKEIVLANNLVGKVVYHSLMIGKVIDFIKGNLLYIIIFSVLLIGLATALRASLSKKNDIEKP